MKYLVATVTMLLLSFSARADVQSKNLYKEAVAPVLANKCGACHGEEKQKGKLRVDSLEAIMKGGSEGASVVAGKPDDSTLLQRVHLPIDDDEHMPPEGKKQLTKEEVAVIEFWVKSGAKGDATVAALKAPAEITKAITAVLAAVDAAPAKAADKPKELTDAQKKLISDTINKVKNGGGNLMAIAQNTTDLRFTALNVAKEFGDQNLKPLEPVGGHIRWLDLARTQVTDKGLASLGAMRNITRLHLENTKITDAALDHVKGLPELEYLNLYGTGVTDAGIAKLAGNKNLKKLYLWQTKATDKGVAQLQKAIPGIDINTGWKEPVVVAAAAKPNEKKPTPAAAAPAKKPTPPKPAVKKPTPPKPAAPKPVANKPAAKPTPPPAPKSPLQTAVDELKVATDKAKKDATAKKAAYEAAQKKAADASKQAAALKAQLDKATEVEQKTAAALQETLKAAEAAKK